MKNFKKPVLSLAENTAPFLFTLSLFALFIDTIKYSGFIEKHFYIGGVPLFSMGFVLNYILVLYDNPENYWWKNKTFKIVQTQSKIILPVTFVFYLIFQLMESYYYPNYVFSNYHLDVSMLLNIIWCELFIFILPALSVNAKKYLLQISKELKLSEKVIGFGLLAILFICLIFISSHVETF